MAGVASAPAWLRAPLLCNRCRLPDCTFVPFFLLIPYRQAPAPYPGGGNLCVQEVIWRGKRQAERASSLVLLKVHARPAAREWRCSYSYRYLYSMQLAAGTGSFRRRAEQYPCRHTYIINAAPAVPCTRTAAMTPRRKTGRLLAALFLLGHVVCILLAGGVVQGAKIGAAGPIERPKETTGGRARCKWVRAGLDGLLPRLGKRISLRFVYKQWGSAGATNMRARQMARILATHPDVDVELQRVRDCRVYCSRSPERRVTHVVYVKYPCPNCARHRGAFQVWRRALQPANQTLDSQLQVPLTRYLTVCACVLVRPWTSWTISGFCGTHAAASRLATRDPASTAR